MEQARDSGEWNDVRGVCAADSAGARAGRWRSAEFGRSSCCAGEGCLRPGAHVNSGRASPHQAGRLRGRGMTNLATIEPSASHTVLGRRGPRRRWAIAFPGQDQRAALLALHRDDRESAGSIARYLQGGGQPHARAGPCGIRSRGHHAPGHPAHVEGHRLLGLRPAQGPSLRGGRSRAGPRGQAPARCDGAEHDHDRADLARSWRPVTATQLVYGPHIRDPRVPNPPGPGPRSRDARYGWIRGGSGARPHCEGVGCCRGGGAVDHRCVCRTRPVRVGRTLPPDGVPVVSPRHPQPACTARVRRLRGPHRRCARSHLAAAGLPDRAVLRRHRPHRELSHLLRVAVSPGQDAQLPGGQASARPAARHGTDNAG